jgi:hypothetical protein
MPRVHCGIGQVDGQGAFADTALLIGDGEGLYGFSNLFFKNVHLFGAFLHKDNLSVYPN